MGRRILVAAVAVLLVMGAGGVLYAFGTPERQVTPPRPVPEAVAPAPQNAPSTAGPGAEPPAQAPAEPGESEVPAPDASSPLAIEIPGCRCHSDDPAQVEAHAEYRMNQCAGCHAGGVPTGQ